MRTLEGDTSGRNLLCCYLAETGPLPFVIDPVVCIPAAHAWERGPRITKTDSGCRNVIVWLDRHTYPSPWHFITDTTDGYAAVPIAQSFRYDLLTPYESLLVVVHARAVPQFDYELARLPSEIGCTRNHGARADKGGQICTFGLCDLSYLHSDFVLANATRKRRAKTSIGNMHGQYVVTFGTNRMTYEACMPVSISYPPRGRNAYLPGAFFAAPITHVMFAHSFNNEDSIMKAKRAGFDVVIRKDKEQP